MSQCVLPSRSAEIYVHAIISIKVIAYYHLHKKPIASSPAIVDHHSLTLRIIRDLDRARDQQKSGLIGCQFLEVICNHYLAKTTNFVRRANERIYLFKSLIVNNNNDNMT